MTATATKIINFRAPAAKQALIDHAAQVSGKNRTEFILDASCEKAWEVLADQTHFALSRQALRCFNELVEAPLANADALRRLLSTPVPWAPAAPAGDHLQRADDQGLIDEREYARQRRRILERRD